MICSSHILLLLSKSSNFQFYMTYGQIYRNIWGTTIRKLRQPVWPPSKISKNQVCLYVGIRAPKPAFAQLCDHLTLHIIGEETFTSYGPMGTTSSWLLQWELFVQVSSFVYAWLKCQARHSQTPCVIFGSIGQVCAHGLSMVQWHSWGPRRPCRIG